MLIIKTLRLYFLLILLAALLYAKPCETKKFDIAISKNISFYELDYDEKIDVVYDMLQEQNAKLAALSKNQAVINDFNKHAFDAIVAASAKNSNAADVAYENINYQYGCSENRINLLG